MKKKKAMALILAAAMTISTIGQTTGIYAADFTDGEAAVQETVSEDADAFAAGVEEEAPDTEEPAEVFTEAEPEEIFADDAEPEMADDTAVIAYGEDTSRANYRGAYVTEEQFMHWKETREEPEGDWVTTSVETTPTDFFKELSGENTGYCLVTVDGESEGYADLNVPDGLTVGLVEHSEVKLRSISGKAVLNGWINTPGTLQIDGELETGSVEIRGTVVGVGSNDTITVIGWTHVNGLDDVENMVFEDYGLDILGGSSEFYNISVKNRPDDNHNVWLNIQGYSDKTIPVFHKNYDFGIQKGTHEDGEPWENEGGVCIQYVKDMSVEEWQPIDPGVGKQMMKFDVDDADILNMINKNWVDTDPEGGSPYRIDMDGKTYIDDWNQLYPVHKYKSGGGMTAQEVFEADGRGDWPWEECQEDICALPSLSQASRAIAAYEKSGKGEGYYFVELPRGGKITETLTVPEGAAGVKYRARNDWNEETEINTPVPMSVSKINAPEGKVVFLGNAFIPSGNITVSGAGKVEINSCELGGIIQGNLNDNTTVELVNGNVIGGLKAVKNLVVDNWGIDITGNVCEIYNISKTERYIYQEDGRQDRNIGINIEGTNTPVVLHEAYDLGMNEDLDGNTWPAGIDVNYIKDMSIDGENWERMDPGEGAQIFKFDMPDTDIVKILNTTGYWLEDKGYSIDMDGKTFLDDENNSEKNYHIMRFKSGEGFTAKEIYDRYGREEWIEECVEHICNIPSLSQAMRIIAVYQENVEEDGYYGVDLPRGAEIETLTVPDNVSGVKYSARNDWNEETQTETAIPVKISKMNVPQGKMLSLLGASVRSGSLAVTGDGTAEIMECRLNQNITAKNLILHRSSVRSVKCDTLIMDRTEVTVSEYLEFKQGGISGDILAKSTAVLNLGLIDNEKFLGHGGGMGIWKEFSSGKGALIHMSDTFQMGTEQNEENGEIYQCGISVLSYDYEKVLAAGAPCANDCFSLDYRMFDEVEEKNPWYTGNMRTYEDENEAVCLMTISKDVEKDFPWESIWFLYSKKVLEARIRHGEEFKPEECVTSDGKYLTAFGTEEGWVKAAAYIQVGDAPAQRFYLADAVVSTIKDQTYTGKALKPSVTVKLDSKTLKNGTDYTVSYKNNTKVGTATVTITGKGNYTGTITKTFKIVQPVPAKGKTFTVGTLKYKVTKSAASNGTVTVSAPVKKTYTSVTIPSTVKINGYTFKVTAIADSAFKSNTKLKTVKIGSYVTTIGKQAFYGCKALKSITISSKVLKTVGSSAFKGIYAKATIKVPSANLKAYTKLLKGKGQASTVKITK